MRQFQINLYTNPEKFSCAILEINGGYNHITFDMVKMRVTDDLHTFYVENYKEWRSDLGRSTEPRMGVLCAQIGLILLTTCRLADPGSEFSVVCDGDPGFMPTRVVIGEDGYIVQSFNLIDETWAHYGGTSLAQMMQDVAKTLSVLLNEAIQLNVMCDTLWSRSASSLTR